MVKTKVFMFIVFFETLLLLAFSVFSVYSLTHLQGRLDAKRELVRQLTLTDVAIWTEARYTRHPSQSDFFSAFQDFPSSIDHFPAGSIVPPGMFNERNQK
ncbi:MAG: hypothetical protein H7844_07845 [Nitrospirae bacterium YQR-1]